MFRNASEKLRKKKYAWGKLILSTYMDSRWTRQFWWHGCAWKIHKLFGFVVVSLSSLNVTPSATGRPIWLLTSSPLNCSSYAVSADIHNRLIAGCLQTEYTEYFANNDTRTLARKDAWRRESTRDSRYVPLICSYQNEEAAPAKLDPITRSGREWEKEKRKQQRPT